MTAKEFDEVARLLAETAPAIWNQAYPRFYGDVAGNYLSLKVPAVVLAGSYLSFATKMSRGHDHGVEAAVFALEVASKYKSPVYYVAKEFLQAVMNSDIPESLRLTDIRYPMPAATFMLPLGMLKHPEEGNIGFITYAYHPKGEFKGRISTGVHTCTADTLICITATHEQETPPLFHMVVTSSEESALTLEGIGETMKNHPFEYSRYYRDDLEAPSDRPFNNVVTNLCLRLLLAMSARPEVVETGRNTGKHLKHGVPIWTPNVVGRTYRIKRQGPAEGGGWHTRMHWRRGHYRLQPHGPQLSLRKTIWIEPCLISAETQVNPS